MFPKPLSFQPCFQANLSGYKAVIEAAAHFGRSFKPLMTAAGKVPPAKVLVIGAGVAGLQAIQTAKNTGAIVRCFDVRADTREQVVSAGGEFLTVEIQEDGAGAGTGFFFCIISGWTPGGWGRGGGCAPCRMVSFLQPRGWGFGGPPTSGSSPIVTPVFVLAGVAPLKSLK